MESGNLENKIERIRLKIKEKNEQEKKIVQEDLFAEKDSTVSDFINRECKKEKIERKRRKTFKPVKSVAEKIHNLHLKNNDGLLKDRRDGSQILKDIKDEVSQSAEEERVSKQNKIYERKKAEERKINKKLGI